MENEVAMTFSLLFIILYLNPPLIDFYFLLPEKNASNYTDREKQHRFSIGIIGEGVN